MHICKPPICLKFWLEYLQWYLGKVRKCLNGTKIPQKYLGWHKTSLEVMNLKFDFDPCRPHPARASILIMNFWLFDPPEKPWSGWPRCLIFCICRELFNLTLSFKGQYFSIYRLAVIATRKSWFCSPNWLYICNFHIYIFAQKNKFL